MKYSLIVDTEMKHACISVKKSVKTENCVQRTVGLQCGPETLGLFLE